MGPPAVVGFQNEGSAVHALLVSSMKTVSLLDVFKEKKAASAESPVINSAATASPSEAASPVAKITQIETAAAPAPETETSLDKAAATAPPAVIVDRETIESIRDSIAALEENAFVNQQMGNAIADLERHVGTMKQLLVEECNDYEYKEEQDLDDDLNHDRAWTDGYNLGYWGNSNHYDAWLAGYQAGVKDFAWKEGDAPIHGNPMLTN
jgi:hypothetical protein